MDQLRAAPGQVRLTARDELKGVALILVVCYHAVGILGWSNSL